jgi:hypothetical protein
MWLKLVALATFHFDMHKLNKAAICEDIGVGSRGSGRRSKIQRYNIPNRSNATIDNDSQDNNRQCNCPAGNIIVTKDYYGSYKAKDMICN